MRFSTSTIALAAISFTSTLLTNTYSSTPTNYKTPTPSSTSCSSPTPTPQPCKPSYPPPPNYNTSCLIPLPATLYANCTRSNIIKPRVTSLYEIWIGAVRYNTTNSKVFKNSKTTNITTLLTFNFPPKSVSGTAQFDVFTALAPATSSKSSWPSGNLRDQHLGRMNAQRGSAATWVSGFPTLGQGFPCPAGETYGGELVGVGDVDFVEWLAGVSGPSIQWF